jgi:hypothetical protein
MEIRGVEAYTWFRVVKSLARATNARLILGVNLEADRTRVAAAEARAMIARIGRPWLQAVWLPATSATILRLAAVSRQKIN